MSEYERGLKTPNLAVAERIIETAGYRLDLVTEVRFKQHVATGLRPFWVPDHLWRGKLPGCFATIVLDDAMMSGRVMTFDLRHRSSRCRFYELLLGHGKPEELMELLDGALLVDAWDDLRIPTAIRGAWAPMVAVAGQGPREHMHRVSDE